MASCRGVRRFATSRCISSGLIAIAFLSTSACTSMQVKMGMKVYLDRTPVSSIQVQMPNGPTLAPGEKGPLVVTFTQPDGKTLTTEGAGQGKIMWKELNVTASVVDFNGKGTLSLASDPRITEGKTGHVTVTVPSHPDLRADLDVSLNYKHNYVASFSGSSGWDGSNGSDGMDGSSGSSGSLDPNNPSAGGNGGDGTNGGDGGDGGRGGDGPAVQVRVALSSADRPLLQVSVAAEGKQTFYLVDPNGGSVTVRSNGGRGGSGGKGGRGGRGGSGGIGSPNGSSGMDGHSGRNGFDGSSGSSGQITVSYDSKAKVYLSAIHLPTGSPKPVLKEEVVAALW